MAEPLGSTGFSATLTPAKAEWARAAENARRKLQEERRLKREVKHHAIHSYRAPNSSSGRLEQTNDSLTCHFKPGKLACQETGLSAVNASNCALREPQHSGYSCWKVLELPFAEKQLFACRKDEFRATVYARERAVCDSRVCFALQKP